MKTNKTVTIFSIVVVILVGVILFLFTRISNLEHNLKISDHNYEVSKSEMVKIKLDNEVMLNERDALILSEKNMYRELEKSKKEIRDLERKLGSSIEYISKIKARIEADSLASTGDSIIYIDKTPAEVKFRLINKWINIDGKSDILEKKTTINNIQIPLPLEIGITDKYSIFVMSENPYVIVDDINAVAVENFVKKAVKRKHWGFGVYLGLGAHYDILYEKFGFGPQLGIGVIYKF